MDTTQVTYNYGNADLFSTLQIDTHMKLLY